MPFTLKSWLGRKVPKPEESDLESAPLVVAPRHDPEKLDAMTKRELLDYAHEHGITINSRKKKEEIILILMRH